MYSDWKHKLSRCKNTSFSPFHKINLMFLHHSSQNRTIRHKLEIKRNFSIYLHRQYDK